MLRPALVAPFVLFGWLAWPLCAAAQTTVDAHWMWSAGGNPAESAPPGKVWFRREAFAPEPSTGLVRIVADDAFTLWVNGRKVGAGEGAKPFRFSLSGLVDRGTIVIAIEAENKAGKAGLLVDGEIRGQGGKAMAFDGPKDWKATADRPAGEAWLKPGFDAAAWQPAQDLGPHDASPWKDIAFKETYLDRYELAPGFEITRVAEPELSGSLVAMTWGNRGRLFGSREGGSIVALIDENKDGTFDKAVEYCDAVKNCQGLCQVGDDLYVVGDGPEKAGVYRLPDRNRDDVADEVVHLVSHKGGMGEHGPHDVVLGPDGWLYHNVGNHAWIQNAPEPNSPVAPPYEGYVLEPRFEDGNGHAAGIKVPGGSIWRFTPDGKQWWLETAGFRNQYDIAFNSHADLFTFDSDMEWDVGQPWYRPVRVNHCIPGAEFGWRSGAANWPPYYFDSLPTTVDVGRGSPTGIVFYEHRQFPREYRGALLCCDWSLGRILAVHLEPHGASYSGKYTTLVSGNPLNVSDIEVDRDGSMLFCTGGRKTEGGVYRVKCRAGEAERAEASDLASLLALPQPQSAWAREDAAKVRDSLADGWAPALEEKARRGQPSEQLRALSLLAQLGPKPSQKLLVDLAKAKDAPVRAFVALLLGDTAGRPTQRALNVLVEDSDVNVRRRACEGLVRAKIPGPVKPLVKMLGSPDKFARFAARLALRHVTRTDWQAAVMQSQDPRAYIEGLLALTQLGPNDLPPKMAFEQELAILKKENLPFDVRFDALRLLQLTLIQTAGKEPLEAQRKIGDYLLEKFPSGNLAYDLEASRALAALQTPGADAKLLAALRSAPAQEEQMHYALCLAYIETDRDSDAMRELLAWYETTQDWEGGYSLAKNLENIVAGSFDRLSPGQRRETLAAWRDLPHSARLLLSRSQPDQIEDYEQTIEELLQNAGDPKFDELMAGVIDGLGKSDSPAAQATLRKLFDDYPDRRPQIARALAAHPIADNAPQYLRTLQFADNATLQVCLKALKDSKHQPDRAETYRLVILAGLRLKQEGGLVAVELLRSWTGQQDGQGNRAEPALAHYQAWFATTYPDAPAAELPASVNDARYNLEQLAELAEKYGDGDAARGEKAFAKANCIKCHRFGVKGEGVGPDLTAVRRRFQRREIAESIVFPSLVISDQYRSVTVNTKAGQVFSGMPASKPDADPLVLLLNDATKIEIPRQDIEEQAPAKVSVMPQGVLKDLSPEETVDLFMFLETSKNNQLPAAAGQ